jgi:hypothetical protein
MKPRASQAADPCPIRVKTLTDYSKLAWSSPSKQHCHTRSGATSNLKTLLWRPKPAGKVLATVAAAGTAVEHGLAIKCVVGPFECHGRGVDRDCIQSACGTITDEYAELPICGYGPGRDIVRPSHLFSKCCTHTRLSRLSNFNTLRLYGRFAYGGRGKPD